MVQIRNIGRRPLPLLGDGSINWSDMDVLPPSYPLLDTIASPADLRRLPAAKLAELGSDYGVDYIEPELNLREELLMQLRSETRALGQLAGFMPRSDIERVLDPVLEQARAIARLNDPRGLYAYCWCREPRMTLKGLAGR